MNSNVLILGGMGPNAAASFLAKAYEILNEADESKFNAVYLDNSVETPSRTLAMMEKGECPVKSIISRIQKFNEFKIQKVYMPCNSVHYWHSEVQSQIKPEWVSMINIVSNYLTTVAERPLLLSGFVPWKSKIYKNSVQYLPVELQRELESAILANKKTGSTILPNELQHYIDNFPGQILLGCTELHLFEGIQHLDLIDTMYLYSNSLAASINADY
ncbi:aspartate/glutamate racemase family protein [Planktomarina sp.]|nr:aspartate/glutamate racemase family protein [Planktomarina sp.]MDB4841051.1 aspartate/glutamate racemase family protein [Planktomarina sp.]